MALPNNIKDYTPKYGSDNGPEVSQHEVDAAIKHMHSNDVYSKDLILDLMYFCLVSTENTCRILFGDRFYKPFSPKIHYPIFEILDDHSIQKFCIVAPRDTGKTTIDTIVYPARRLLFTENHNMFCPFYVPIGNNETNAVMQAENLKRELMTNRFVNKIFGSIKTHSVDLGLPFSTKQWATSKGSLVFPRGRGQAVRGILWGKFRPFLIMGDDLEDKEEVRNEERRKDTKEWWREDVGNSIEIGRSDWRIGVIGSLLHEDSLLSNLVENDTWVSVTLSIATENFQSSWPEHLSDKQIQIMRKEHHDDNMLDSFYREYMSLPTSTEDASFTKKNFRWYQETDEAFQGRLPRMINVVIGDPAKTEKMQSADSAIVGVGLDRAINSFFVRDIIHGKMFPDEFYDHMINMGLNLRRGSNCDQVGIEATGLEQFVIKPFKDRMVERGVFFEVVELKARRGSGEYSARGKGKEGRVAGLVKYYRQGNVWHNEACCGPLEAQLMGFPRSKKWDIMDALAYITFMFEHGLMYFGNTGVEDIHDTPERIESEAMKIANDAYESDIAAAMGIPTPSYAEEFGDDYFPDSLDDI